MYWEIGYGFIPIVLLLLLAASLRILREYQRAVVFQLGRFWMVKGPGLVILIPGIQQMVRVDLRTVVMDVPPQDVITRDNVSVKVNAVVYFRVMDPQRAIIQVEDFLMATSQLAQTTLRAILGKHELDQLLADREKLNLAIQQVLDVQTDAWGIKVANVEIKHVDLNETMVRAIARQAEAERERRAKVIHAEGELQASEKLLQAAQKLAQAPEAMQLRYLQTLTQIAGEKSSTIVFPMPIDLFRPVLDRLTGATGARGQGSNVRRRNVPGHSPFRSVRPLLRVHHPEDERRQDDLHRERQLAAWHDQRVRPRHERVVDHRQQVREVDATRVRESDDEEALVRGRDVARDERVRGVHRRHTLEIDVRARELRADVVHVVGHAAQDRVHHGLGRVAARALVAVQLLDPFEVDAGRDADEQVHVSRDVVLRRLDGAVQALVEEQVRALADLPARP